MNHSKIAAALHALADAFLADVEAVEAAVTGKPARGKAKAAAVDASPAAAATAPAASPASAPAATASVAAVAAPAEPPAPSVPTVTLKDVNALVLKLAATHRDDAKALLGKLKLTNTVGLPQERWQEVFDAFEEAIAKRDAAAVQVAQASLV